MTAPIEIASADRVPDIVQLGHDNGDGTILMVTWAPPPAVCATVELFLRHICGEPHASAIVPMGAVDAANEALAGRMVLHVREGD